MTLLNDLETRILSPSLLNEDGVRSASIAILEDNGDITSHVITTGNEKTDTLYQACSISKSVTALAVVKLIDEGHISYETKIIDHIPYSILRKTVDSRSEHLLQYVTIGHLLSHTSGLSQGHFYGYSEKRPSYEQLLGGEPPSNTRRVTFLSFPGAQKSYSGAGFVLIQLLPETKLGMPFTQIMRKTVFEPLEITRSTYADSPPSESNYAKAHYTAQSLAPGGPDGYWRFVELAAAGLWTMPTDLMKVVRAVQKSLNGDDGFVSKEIATKMLTTVSPIHPTMDIAMGFSVDEKFFILATLHISSDSWWSDQRIRD